MKCPKQFNDLLSPHSELLIVREDNHSPLFKIGLPAPDDQPLPVFYSSGPEWDKCSGDSGCFFLLT